MPTITSVLTYGPTVILLAQLAVVLAELAQGTGNGPEKRAQALAKLKEFQERLGLRLPRFLQAYEETLLGLLIDALVAAFNKAGLFAHTA